MTTAKRTFRTQFNSKYTGTPYQVQDSVSKTIPDMSLTLRQLLDNHTRGIGSGVAQLDGQYYDEEIPKITDLSQITERRIQLEEDEARLKEAIKAEAAEKEALRKAKKQEESPTPTDPPKPSLKDS